MQTYPFDPITGKRLTRSGFAVNPIEPMTQAEVDRQHAKVNEHLRKSTHELDAPEPKPEEGTLHKTLFIMRGIPGSGKSTLCKLIAQGMFGANPDLIRPTFYTIRSTDTLFYKDGHYEFDPKLLGQNHTKNQNLVESDMQSGVWVIFVDNTNTRAEDIAPYSALAKRYGYEERRITVELDVEKCLRYNNERERKVPESVIRRHHQRLFS